MGGAERDADLARCGWIGGKLPLLDVDRCLVGAACLALHGAAHELALRDAVDPRPHLPDLREHDAVPADAGKVPVGGDRRGDLRNRSLDLAVVEVAACELDVAGLVGLDRVLTGLELGEPDVLPLLDATEEVLVGGVEVAKGVDEGCGVGFLEPRLRSYEEGRRLPKKDRQAAIAEALNIDITELMFYDFGDPNRAASALLQIAKRLRLQPVAYGNGFAIEATDERGASAIAAVHKNWEADFAVYSEKGA